MILVPPEEPRIIDRNGDEIYSVIGPYEEGDNLYVTCEVSGGKFKGKRSLTVIFIGSRV